MVGPDEFNDTTATGAVAGSALMPRVVHLDPLAVTTALQQRGELGLSLAGLGMQGFPTGPGQPNPDVLTRYLDNGLKDTRDEFESPCCYSTRNYVRFRWA